MRTRTFHPRLESLDDRWLPSTYFAYDLGSLGGTQTELDDINIHGQVVGRSLIGDGSFGAGLEHAFIWNRGTMIDLGSLGGPTYNSSASGINDLGQVVGISEVPDPNGGYSPQRGFIVTPEDTDGNGSPDRWYRDTDNNGINDLMRNLGTLGGNYTTAFGINNSGQVVGISMTASDGLYAFRWQNGQMTNLGALYGGSNWSYGYGINTSGQVVGVSSAGSSTPAFQWDSGRGLTNLGALPGHSDATALEINDAGVVVGYSGAPYADGRAVTWTPGSPNGTPGPASSLGTLPGDTASDASDINNSGQVVGTSYRYAVDGNGYWYQQATRAVQWQGGVATDLNGLVQAGSGWAFRSAAAINDSGQIVGAGSRAGGSGDAFLLSPTDLGLPLVSIGDVDVVEGNSGMTNAVFTVTLSAPSTQTVTVAYATEDSVIPTSLDYVPTTGTLTFAPGQTTKTITVPVYADTLDEIDKTFNVRLSQPVGVAFADGLAVGTIRNDDPVPTLTVSAVSVLEGNAGTTDAVFSVTLSPAADQPRSVWIETEGYTEWGGYSDDYEATGAELVFAPGETVKTFTVRVVGDTLPEPNETFRVIANYNGSVFVTDDGVGTILNDETPLPMPDVSNPTIIEGNAGTTNAVFTVTLAMGALSGPVTFTYQTSNGSATAGSDYTAVNGTITFDPGETEKTISVPVHGETLYEYDEYFYLNVVNPTLPPYTQDTGTATITNDDAIPTVTVGNVAAREGNSGTTAFAFTLNLSAPSGAPLAYYYAPEPGTATPYSDYEHISGYAGFNVGATTTTVVVPVLGDTLFEGDETFFLQLYYNEPSEWESPVPIEGARGTGTIQNDEQNNPQLTIGDAFVSEGNTGTRTATFTLSLSGPPTQPVTVNFNTANGTASAGSDYQSKSSTVIFAVGQATQTITVLVNGDRLGEPDETFTVNLTGALNATIVDGQGIGTIFDDEPRVNINDVTRAEGANGQTTLFTFTVTLSTSYDLPVTFSFSTKNGTAKTSNNDYVAKNGTLTFAPGETTKTITIEVKGDNKREANETFDVDLTGLSANAVFGKKRGIGTILNDD